MRTIQDMIQQEIQVCVSSLVSTLAAPNDDTRGNLASLCEQAAELAAPVEDWEEAARQAGWTQQPGGRWWREPHNAEECDSENAEMFCGSGPFIYADSAQEACELDDTEPYQWEVYEHWAVSPWFAGKLIAQGERVDTDFAGLNVWARTTTGQAIRADAVIERIYAATHKQDAA